MFRKQTEVFARSSATSSDIITAGERAIVCLYNDSPDISLDELRYRKFCDKVVTKKSHITSQTLPPTSAAYKYHSLRVYYQVQTWKGLTQLHRPSSWGWNCTDGKMKPVTTDLPAAPTENHPMQLPRRLQQFSVHLSEEWF